MNPKYLIKKIIYKFFPNFIYEKRAVRNLLVNGSSIILYGEKTFDERVEEAITNIATKTFPGSKEYKKMRKEMAKAYIKYKAKPMEYLLMNFKEDSKSNNENKLTDGWRDYYMFKYSSIERIHELKFKYGLYCRLKNFFRRDAISIDENAKFDDFLTFARNHLKFIIKPEKGACGRGIHIYTYISDEETRVKFEELSKSNWICESLIQQHSDMAKWNPDTVNTVRIPSIMTSNGPVILQPFFRTGRKGMVVDNAGAGGIYAVIDEVTGKIITDGFSEKGIYYPTHPDSKIKFKDSYIPQFKELIEFNKLVHSTMKEHKYLGNDFALTPNGWVLVESNWGQFVGQYVTKEGIKDKFESLMKQ